MKIQPHAPKISTRCVLFGAVLRIVCQESNITVWVLMDLTATLSTAAYQRTPQISLRCIFHEFITLTAKEYLARCTIPSQEEEEARSVRQLCVNEICKPSVMHFDQLTFADIWCLPVYSSAHSAANQYCKYWAKRSWHGRPQSSFKVRRTDTCKQHTNQGIEEISTHPSIFLRSQVK